MKTLDVPDKNFEAKTIITQNTETGRLNLKKKLTIQLYAI